MKDEVLQDFIKELTVYLEDYAIPNSDLIQEIRLIGRTNRGHGIGFILKSENQTAEGLNSMPVLYAEELLEAFPGASTPAIGEQCHRIIAQDYKQTAMLVEQTKNMLHHDIESIDSNELILTAVPLHFLNQMDPDAYVEDDKKIVQTRRDDLGLLVTIKAPIHRSEPDENGKVNTYYAPVLAPEGIVDKKYYEIAEKNCILATRLRCEMMDKDMGIMSEPSQFYDYFYLLSADKIFREIFKDMPANIDKFLIMPITPYDFGFIGIHNGSIKNSILRTYPHSIRRFAADDDMINQFLDNAYAGAPLPLYIIDRQLKLKMPKKICGRENILPKKE